MKLNASKRIAAAGSGPVPEWCSQFLSILKKSLNDKPKLIGWRVTEEDSYIVIEMPGDILYLTSCITELNKFLAANHLDLLFKVVKGNMVIMITSDVEMTQFDHPAFDS